MFILLQDAEKVGVHLVNLDNVLTICSFKTALGSTSTRILFKDGKTTIYVKETASEIYSKMSRSGITI